MTETPSHRNAAIYLRASLDTTGEREAVQRHENACIDLASLKRWSVVGTYEDNSISSKKGVVRPGYEAMMRDYAAGKFDAIITWDLDRLTRVPRELEDMIDACEEGSLALVTANGEADLTTDGGKLYARVKVAVARGEVERKGARQRLAQKQRAEVGRPPRGIRPTGYTLDGEIVADEAAVITRIFDRFSAGDTLKGIAADLDHDGLPTSTGARWSSSSVSSILRNARYAGRSVYKGEVVGRGSWDALVTEAQFDAVQARLDDPRRKTRGVSTARKHLGSGLYFCSCGLRIRSSSGLGNGLNRYTCRAACYYRSAGPVDDYVSNVVMARLARPDLAELLVKPVDGDQLAQYATQREHLRHQRAAAESEWLDGLVDGHLFRAKADRIDSELQAIQAAEAKLLSSAGPPAILAAPAPEVAFADASLAMRRATIDSLMHVTLIRAPRGSRNFDPDTVRIEWRQA